MFRFSIRTLILAFFLLASTNAFAAGNNVNGTIQGQTLDSNGNPISGVTVTVTNPTNGVTRSVESDADGDYFISLPIGVYDVSSSLEGASGTNVDDIAVSLGSDVALDVYVATNNESIEELVVLGQASKANIDVASTGLNISIEEIESLPVARNIESVALLTPGAVLGDSAFGDDKQLVSLGGASVAENVYYVDGLNVTNFRNGLGGSRVPFEFYQDFQIKTGGYSAEFGRSTGGVLNAVTKRGTNEWHAGVVSYYEPDSLRSNSPDTFYADGRLYDHNVKNEKSTFVTDLYASGPIIKDKLFFYALYEFSDIDEELTATNTPTNRILRTVDDDFYGVNIFWNINDSNSLTLTHYTDERRRNSLTYTSYDLDSGDLGSDFGDSYEDRGGENTLIRWDGQVTDTLSASVLYGENEYALADSSSLIDACPNVVNNSAITGLSFIASCTGDFLLAEEGGDKREALRIDLEWQLNDHLIRFGLDDETNTTNLTTTYPAGGHYYRYFDFEVGTQLSNGYTVENLNGNGSAVTVVRDRFLQNGGAFETTASALYLEDIWQVTDQLTLSLGIRSESFDNKNADGGTFIKLDNQIAPRLGLEYDFGGSGGDGSSSFFANWGRYHLPVANNTNARLAGNELFTEIYYLFDGGLDPVTAAPTSVSADGTPTTTQLGDVNVFGDGSVPDVRTVLDETIDPMFQDEIIIGYTQDLNDLWSVTAKYTQRELSSAIDDITVLDTGHYVLTNPGTDLIYFDDFNGDGEVERISLTAEELGYPEATREYKSLELSVNRAFDEKWAMNASYTYSDSKGNSEGLVKSDNGQDDAGLTTDFDFPVLMDGAFGSLPNDREHVVKAFGNYQLNDNISFGGNLTYASGRPINRFGAGHPSGNPSYGDTYYTYDIASDTFTFNPRGSEGRTPSTFTLDLRADYSMQLGDDLDLRFSLDIFNVLDADSVTEVFEVAEQDGAAGAPDDRYGLASIYQAPRTIRFGVSLRY